MNQSVLQKIILSFFITLFIPTNSMMDTIKRISYKFIESKIIYKIGVSTIDSIAASLSHFAIWFIHITYNKRNNPIRYTLFENRAQQKLQQIEDNLLIKEKQIINAIYDDYNITMEQRKVINSIVDQAKEYEKKYMSEPHHKATQEIELPPFITSLCSAHNINPGSIETMTESSDEPFDAGARGLRLNGSLINDTFNVHAIVATPIIIFRPSFFKLSESGQYLTWGHEARHLILQHYMTKFIILNCINSVTLMPFGELERNKNYLLLKIEHEKQAETLCNNAHLASLTRKSRSSGYYPDTLFLSHYAQLAEIDELYKFPDNLKTYKPIPLQKTHFPTY
jgi:hypothetical protein